MNEYATNRSGALRVRLRDRGVLRISGEERVAFLQGLVSNDVRKVSPQQAVYAALLTPQGKFLHDFLMVEHRDALLLDCESERRQDLLQRLTRYKLRSKVRLEDATEEFGIGVAFGGDAASFFGLDGRERGAAVPFGGGVALVDPRLPELGVRVLHPAGGGEAMMAATGIVQGAAEDYERLRLRLGVPAGSRDMPVDKAFLLESGFDELGGVDWQKGCYVGQELTARTKYRGLVRKRLLPVTIEGPMPQPGTAVMLGDRPAGDLRSVQDGMGLALLRLEMVAAAGKGEGTLTAGDATLVAAVPQWVRLPENASADPD